MQLWSNFFDVLFPPSEEARLVRALARSHSIHNFYTPQSFQNTTALMTFRSPTVRALIHEAKFHHNSTAFILLASILQTHLTTHHYPAPTLIIPIPLSPRRERERGYNQVLEVLKRVVVDKSIFTIRTDIMVRRAHTKPQTALSKTERLTNLTNAFYVPKGDAITGNSIILIDDVMTTGATLEAARVAILPHSPHEITTLALAH